MNIFYISMDILRHVTQYYACIYKEVSKFEYQSLFFERASTFHTIQVLMEQMQILSIYILNRWC